jgi:hypothetical protein
MLTAALKSAGPKKNTKDLLVHIIKVVEDPPQSHSASATPAGLKEAARLVGKPAPTDIVVFAHQPWPVVNGELKAHPQVHIDHPETILRVSYAKKEQPVWWSEQPFTITAVHESHHGGAGPAAGAPHIDPFDGPQPPYVAQPETDAGGHETIWLVRAPTIVQLAIGHTFKITFNIGEDIDPDMEGTP